MFRFTKFHLLFFFVASTTIFSCSNSKETTTGTSEAALKATTTKSAKTVHSVDEEYEWVYGNFPGAQVYERELIYEKSKYFDVLKFETQLGDSMVAYFDITCFYGK